MLQGEILGGPKKIADMKGTELRADSACKNMNERIGWLIDVNPKQLHSIEDMEQAIADYKRLEDYLIDVDSNLKHNCEQLPVENYVTTPPTTDLLAS